MHVTTRAAAVHAQFAPALEAKLSPVAKVSITVTLPVVGEVSLFVTLMVYAPVEPTTKSPAWLFVIVTSGETPVPFSVRTLLPGRLSAIVTVMGPRAPSAVGLKTYVRLQLAPAARTVFWAQIPDPV